MRVPASGKIFLAYFGLQIVSGLWELGWNPAALPGWYWAAALLSGVLGLLGVHLIRQAKPQRPFWTRALLIGLGWSLPITVIFICRDMLTGEFFWPRIVILPLLSSLIYGPVMASFQNGPRQSG